MFNLSELSLIGIQKNKKQQANSVNILTQREKDASRLPF